ncbi:MAG: hypothetical protein AAF713_01495 [Pseudomonadota bacterium]
MSPAILLRRWLEPGLAAAMMLATLWEAAGALQRGAMVGWLLVLAGGILALWLRAAILGAMSGQSSAAPGVVLIREGEIGYLGPVAGGFVALEAVRRIEISRRSPFSGAVWRLVTGTEPVLEIPAGAEGAEHLAEALTALPGFSDLAVARILGRRLVGEHLVWERAGEPAQARLG